MTRHCRGTNRITLGISSIVKSINLSKRRAAKLVVGLGWTPPSCPLRYSKKEGRVPYGTESTDTSDHQSLPARFTVPSHWIVFLEPLIRTGPRSSLIRGSAPVQISTKSRGLYAYERAVLRSNGGSRTVPLLFLQRAA